MKMHCVHNNYLMCLSCVCRLQNLLKEVAGNLQMLFQQVEPEKDYAFFNRPPGEAACMLD